MQVQLKSCGLLLVIVVIQFRYSTASQGDRSYVYQKCRHACVRASCTGAHLQQLSNDQPMAERLLRWSCSDDCQYDCMWTTVDAFQKDGLPVPQFHGKWPFVRLLGVQEPASMVFSVLNLLGHLNIFRYRRVVSSSTPMYYVWHGMAAVAINGWAWSTIFHTRDTTFTEMMDYFCAFSMVLYGTFSLVCRLLGTEVWWRPLAVGVGCLLFYAQHIHFLAFDRFDYGYNMQVNVAVGFINMIGWFVWCVWKRKEQRYVWKCVGTMLGINIFLSLELLDFPPLLWTFDAHSLWHAGTAPFCLLWYSFVIDDGLYLQSVEEGLPKKHV